MTTLARPRDEKDDLSWYIVGRWREYEGKARANLLRMVGIAAFYLVELANYRGFRLGGLEMPRLVDRPFHLAVTSVAVAWTMLGLGVHLCLSRRIFPAALKFVSTGGDLLLMTCVLAVSNGPRSPLIVGYFLILALAALRFSLPLIWFATAGGMLGYLALLAHAKWFVPGASGAPISRGHVPPGPRPDGDHAGASLEDGSGGWPRTTRPVARPGRMPDEPARRRFRRLPDVLGREPPGAARCFLCGQSLSGAVEFVPPKRLRRAGGNAGSDVPDHLDDAAGSR